MRKKFTFIFLFCLFVATFAQAQTREFRSNQVIGDGKEGRSFAKWQGEIGNAAVGKVTVKLQKRSGGSDTYVNLRFGDDDTLEGGKRQYLNDNSFQTISWDVGGEQSKNRPLILNAYNGEVLIELIKVDFIENTPPTGGPLIPRPEEGSDQLTACRELYRIGYPRIDIGKVKPTGNIFSGDQKVSGSIYAQCVQEAGYFEYGDLKEKIDFPLSDRFQRKSFSVKIRQQKNGEIRVYTTDGQEAVMSVD